MDPPADDDDASRQADPFAPKVQGPLLGRIIPVTRRLPGYVADSLRPDTVAGLTVAALAVPSAMAYAQLAGLSPVAGLYALLLPGCRLRGLRYLAPAHRRPEGTLAIMVAGAVAPLVGTDDPTRYAALAAMSAVLVGGIALVARVLRLGWISDYFSLAVLVGYLHGVAVVLIVGQMEKLTGMSIDASDPIPQLGEFFREIGSANGTTVVVAARVTCRGPPAEVAGPEAAGRLDRRRRWHRRVVRVRSCRPGSRRRRRHPGGPAELRVARCRARRRGPPPARRARHVRRRIRRRAS